MFVDDHNLPISLQGALLWKSSSPVNTSKQIRIPRNPCDMLADVKEEIQTVVRCRAPFKTITLNTLRRPSDHVNIAIIANGLQKFGYELKDVNGAGVPETDPEGWSLAAIWHEPFDVKALKQGLLIDYTQWQKLCSKYGCWPKLLCTTSEMQSMPLSAICYDVGGLNHVCALEAGIIQLFPWTC